MSNLDIEALVSSYLETEDFSRKVEILAELERIELSLFDIRNLPSESANLFLSPVLNKIHRSAATLTIAPSLAPAPSSLAPTISRPGQSEIQSVVLASAPNLSTHFAGGVAVFDGLDNEAKDLILAALKCALPNIDGYTIQPLQAGFSGSLVFSVQPSIGSEMQPIPWIAKIGESDKLRVEFENSRTAAFKILSPQCFFTEAGPRGCLVQKLASVNTTWPEPISKIIWPGMRNIENLVSPDELKIHLEKFASQYRTASQRTLVIHSICDFFPGLTQKISTRKISSRMRMYDFNPDHPFFETSAIPNIQIHNPLYTFSRLIDRNPSLESYQQFLHGDLHCNNLQVDSYGIPWPIDWGSARNGHYLFDIASLETSILMNCIPIGYDPNSLFELMKTLSLPTLGCRDDSSPTERTVYSIQIIRGLFFDNETPLNGFDYDLCLFLVSIQQLQYEDLSFWTALIQAHNAIEKLYSTWPEMA